MGLLSDPHIQRNGHKKYYMMKRILAGLRSCEERIPSGSIKYKFLAKEMPTQSSYFHYEIHFLLRLVYPSSHAAPNSNSVDLSISMYLDNIEDRDSIETSAGFLTIRSSNVFSFYCDKHVIGFMLP